jgi:hypothetical protein
VVYVYESFAFLEVQGQRTDVAQLAKMRKTMYYFASAAWAGIYG